MLCGKGSARRGRWRLVLAALSLLLGACGNKEPIEESPFEAARALNAGGMRRYREGDLEEAETLFSAALREAAGIDDLRGKAAALYNLALVHRELNRPSEALEETELSEAIFREVGDFQAAARALALGGTVRLLEGDLEGAAAAHRRALEAAKDGVRAEVLAGLASVLIETGELERARAAAEEAIRLAKEDAVRSDALFNLGRARLLGGERAEARKHLEEALDLDHASGRRLHVALTLGLLGRASCEEGRREEAQAFLERAAGVYEGMGLAAAAEAARNACPAGEARPSGPAAPDRKSAKN